MSYTLKYKIRGERVHVVPLRDVSEEEALQQFEDALTSLSRLGTYRVKNLVCNRAVFVQLFTGEHKVPHRERLF